MAAKQPAPSDALKQVTYLAATLKAPRITEAAARLADQARDAGWTHEDYLAAVLERESARATLPGPGCGSARPGFLPSRHSRTSTSMPQPAARQQVGALASGGF